MKMFTFENKIKIAFYLLWIPLAPFAITRMFYDEVLIVKGISLYGLSKYSFILFIGITFCGVIKSTFSIIDKCTQMGKKNIIFSAFRQISFYLFLITFIIYFVFKCKISYLLLFISYISMYYELIKKLFGNMNKNNE